ncbi:CRISPR-associated endonuclease Cas2 [Candidatus Kaiserbacteria bacterium RIFCSPHIGHO2_01_FULL_55_17]|uniref:CRISPR-associated endoribonuclease Cas2 n=1 Tax=Candidatus Kaiserbacteria bacterium RIFCSPHIGHO2_01_FULL_55_17 TaxID=1798484 RepID=A0A1F6D7X2_9BACT|nr:MAG: CRISPR-associated endonuclease Cas2 [Candidatus Kaiserbacteria bacterium RIFCSPHIGHO2_01_FULL_55_17]
MGKMENAVRKQRKKRYIQDAILTTLAGVGALAVVALAPAVLIAVGQIAKQSGYKMGWRARTAAGRLAQKGLVRFVEIHGKKHVEITEAGRRFFALESAKLEARTHRKLRWDRRYRMVIFDIPETRRGTRERLRRLMREFGFLRIQDSVWVSPHECEELVALIKAELRIGKDVLYVIVESIENDAWVRRYFNLPQE